MPGEFGYRYAYAAQHIKEVLNKVEKTGRPEKLTNTYLKENWLLKNAQYTAVLEILKDMKFISSDGTPTERYAEYQNHTNSSKIRYVSTKLSRFKPLPFDLIFL